MIGFCGDCELQEAELCETCGLCEDCCRCGESSSKADLEFADEFAEAAQLHVQVKLTPESRWRGGTLTTDWQFSKQGLPVVMLDGTAYGPRDVEAIRVKDAGQLRLVEKALDAGFTVYPLH